MLLPDSKTELVRRGNKVVYDLGDKIVKVFNETKPVSDVFNEALNLARINECGIRSPKALEVSQLENANGWALVTEKVAGTTLADKMTAEPQRFGEYLEMSSTSRSRSTATPPRCSTVSATSSPA